MDKEKNKVIQLSLLWIALVLCIGFLIGFAVVASIQNNGAKNLYAWCKQDVLHNEPYGEAEVFGWTVEEISIEYNQGCEERHYIITVIRGTVDGEPDDSEIAFDYWLCSIAYKMNFTHRMFRLFDSNDWITAKEIKWIDCDWYKTEIIPSDGLISGVEVGDGGE